MLHSRLPHMAALAFSNIELSQCSRCMLIELLVYRIGAMYKCLISAVRGDWLFLSVPRLAAAMVTATSRTRLLEFYRESLLNCRLFRKSFRVANHDIYLVVIDEALFGVVVCILMMFWEFTIESCCLSTLNHYAFSLFFFISLLRPKSYLQWYTNGSDFNEVVGVEKLKFF